MLLFIHFVIGALLTWAAYKWWRREDVGEFTVMMLLIGLLIFFVWPVAIVLALMMADWEDIFDARLWTKKDGWFWRKRVK